MTTAYFLSTVLNIYKPNKIIIQHFTFHLSQIFDATNWNVVVVERGVRAVRGCFG